MSWLFRSDGQNFSASATVLPVNIEDWFLFGFRVTMNVLVFCLCVCHSLHIHAFWSFVSLRPSSQEHEEQHRAEWVHPTGNTSDRGTGDCAPSHILIYLPLHPAGKFAHPSSNCLLSSVSVFPALSSLIVWFLYIYVLLWTAAFSISPFQPLASPSSVWCPPKTLPLILGPQTQTWLLIIYFQYWPCVPSGFISVLVCSAKDLSLCL